MINNKALIFFAASMLLSITLFTGYQYVFQPNILLATEKRDVEEFMLCIPKGTTYDELLRKMTKMELVHEPLSFAFLSKFMKYRENVKPGCYLLKKEMTNVEAIRLLRSGDQTEVKLTFSNARFIEDLAGDLTRNSVADSVTMSRLLRSSETASSYGFTKETFVSMFIPNTYKVYWTSTEEDILERMHKEYMKFWTDEKKTKAEKQGLTPVEVSTLASIVQNESLNKEEQPKVAGLYLNRLKKGMRLEADPTVKFALGDFEIKRVLYKHLEVDSPYNTYKNTGLPPGPISMPHISAIEAVLNPDDVDYIYMCGIGDGSEKHNFAKTFLGHQKNIVIYKRNLRKRGKQ